MRASAIALLKESVAIAVLGVAVALAANALSPRGLSLSRDYFAAAPQNSPTAGRSVAATAQPNSTDARAVRRLSHAAVGVLHADPRRIQDRIIFIDARPDTAYAAAHIPGALHFDHYHPEGSILAVLGAAAMADQLVVYCTGGNCDDSERVAGDLAALGVPVEKLAIYEGGFAEWTAHHGPLETGDRNSSRGP